MSSHLSTIQILEILSKIQSYYPVDPDLLQSIKKWIQSRQESDGSFIPLPADKEVDYYPVDLKIINGTEQESDVNEYYYYDKDGNMTQEEIKWERRVEVTAETLSTLLEVGVENQRDADVANKAQAYLEKNIFNLTSPAALAATVLALVLARSPIVPEALMILRNASTTEEGEFGWPAPRKDAADWLLEENSRNIKTTSYEAVTMEQYVAGVRVLLAACARSALSEGEAAARFLYYRASTLQRHPSLAYTATKAAAQFAALAHDRHRALTVSLATAGMELTDTLELRAKSPPRPLQLPGLPTKVFVYATGAGCATVQGTTTYSTYTPKPENTLLNIQSAIIEEIRPERSSLEELQGNLPTLNIKTCFRWKSKERSGILRLEVSLFSGYELHSVNPVVLDESTFADLHYGSRGESLWFVFANVSSACPVCITYQVRSTFVITSLRPAFAKIYPSTRPDLAVETFFHAHSGSPLLRGITDDDFITWFDKSELASLKNNANIENICECGRLCSPKEANDKKENDKDDSKLGVDKNITGVTEKVMTTDKIVSSTEELVAKLKLTITLPTFTVITDETKTETESKTDFTTLPTEIFTASNVTEGNDDPIIIPTATFINDTTNMKIEDNLVPLVTKEGELIVQKISASKLPEIKKKPLPRRKGTLKSTYGDKHEKLMLKMSSYYADADGTSKKSILHKLPLKKVISTVMLPKTHVSENNTKSNAKKIKIEVINSKEIENFEKKFNETIKPEDILQTTTKFIKAISTIAPTVLPQTETPTTTQHSTTTINNNIKIIFQRTKKPKDATQIKKPVITEKHQNDTNVKMKNNTATVKVKINDTKLKNITHEKFTMKPLKSINKEIHKVPSLPISETSKIMSENTKSDIAPENRGGFEILDKNNLGASQQNVWELLKENSDIDIVKEDKLHKINHLSRNVSNVNDNRSL